MIKHRSNGGLPPIEEPDAHVAGMPDAHAAALLVGACALTVVGILGVLGLVVGG